LLRYNVPAMKLRLPPFHQITGAINFKKNAPSREDGRIYTIPLVLIILIFIFFVRLFHLTVVKGSYYRFAAENNRLREILIEGKRGIIYDRKGYVLASSTPDYHRKYNDGFALAHVLGYRSIASEQDLEHDACQEPLRLNDKIGVKGVEALFECHLRPIKGKRLIEVDAQGKTTKTLSVVSPKSGKPITLSVDSELQKKAMEIIEQNDITTSVEVDLREKNIAIVATKPSTGEILMLLSYPSFEPQMFESGDKELTQQYLHDKRKPLFDRVLQGTYPPGSVFKLIVAAGALQESVISPEETYNDVGFIKAGPSTFNNWYYTQYGRTEGEVNMVKALRRSTDTYFYKAGERLTADKIKVWAERFGLGKQTGIDFDEQTGVVPSDFWKREIIGEKWFLGDTYNLSIGQGYLLVTPLQINLATAVFANGGQLCLPQILKPTAKENKELLKNSAPTCKSLHLKAETLKTIREGMKQACESGGTGWPLFNFGVKDDNSTTSGQLKRIYVGCKTGTAENPAGELPHAWFTVFAPFDKPEIALTVLVENSGEGSNVAAPIAKEILKYYFERNQ